MLSLISLTIRGGKMGDRCVCVCDVWRRKWPVERGPRGCEKNLATLGELFEFLAFNLF